VFVNPRQQGDIGEASAAMWLASKGATVCIPLGHSPDWDLVVEWMGRFARVQVKTSSYIANGRWQVRVSTSGGNQSWTGLVKRFSPERCDYLFVHVGDGRRWLIPSHAVEASISIKLGGPKYSEYEVDRGAPLPSWTVREAAA
jgi:hypothetical protein